MTPEEKGERRAMKCLNDWIDAMRPNFNPIEMQELKRRMSAAFKEYEIAIDQQITNWMKSKHEFGEAINKMNKSLDQRNENTKVWIQAETQTREYANKLKLALEDIRDNSGHTNGCAAGCGHTAEVALGEKR